MDRTQKWEPIALPHVPTIPPMRWALAPDGKFDLVSVPLHGYGNKSGQGEGVPIMTYRKPPIRISPGPPTRSRSHGT
jgi:hypothetical protein